MTSERQAVLVLGESGRVGAVVADCLRLNAEVITVGRFASTDRRPFEAELRRALDGATAVLNLAGVAHLGGDPTDSELSCLVSANVELPLLLAHNCLVSGVPLIHVSSSKAAFSRGAANGYSWSKRFCDATLSSAFGSRFADVGLSLSILRPPALLFPPFDAGKLRLLRKLAVVPSALIPPIPMPVLANERFVNDVVELTMNQEARRAGVRIIEYPANERADLRVVHEALVLERKRAVHAV